MKLNRKIGIGAEGLIHKQFASLISGYEAHNLLNCLFWSYNASGEKRTPMTGSLLKAKGLKKGMPDYIFLQKDFIRKSNVSIIFFVKIIFIEFKAGKNKQSASQVDFENKFKGLQNSSYYTCYSVSEAITALEKEGVIKNT